jgi:UDP-glucose 4-epimerase
LYGVGQATGKPQGLLTHIARNIIRNKPIGIFVPIDTIRDYIAADDAAAEVIDTLREISDNPALMVKIVASGQPVTIAEIISIFKRIARRPPRITTSASKSSALYQRRVQFRSIVGAGRRRQGARSLVIGIAQLFAAESFSYANPGRRAVGERPSLD